jgi:hemolysin activation/secretion protein
MAGSLKRPGGTNRWSLCTVLLVWGCLLSGFTSAQSSSSQTLDVWEFVVDGNTVLDDETIERTLAPFMGPSRTPDDVDKARSALEDTYRDKGYRTVAVTIPQQKAADGVVQLKVQESRVGHLKVIGSKYHSLDRIVESAPSLAEGKVPDFKAVQNDLVILNQQADRRVTPALKAGVRPGTVDVDLVVEDSLPLHGALELNNRYSQDTTELRSLASLSYDNLLQRGHSLSVSFQTAPQNPDDAKVMFGSYLAPVSDSKWSILLNTLKTDSAVSTVGGINVLGSGSSVSVTGIRQIEGPPDFYPSLSVGIGYKDFDTTTLLGSADFKTPVKYFPVTLGYSLLWRGAQDMAQFDTSLTFASPQLGSDTATIQLNRFNARGQMFYLRTSLSNTHDFDNAAQVYARLSGQISDQPLISNEQISAGGMDTARGYLEAEALGDYGITGTVELRSPPIGESLKVGSISPLQGFRVFLFADAARMTLNGPLPDADTPDRTELFSVGAGLTLQLFQYLNGVVDWSYPVVEGPSTPKGSDRVLFRVWTSF